MKGVVTSKRRKTAPMMALCVLVSPAHAAYLFSQGIVENESGRVAFHTDAYQVPTGLVGYSIFSLNGLSTTSNSGDLATGEFRSYSSAQAPFAYYDGVCDGIPCRIPTSGGSATSATVDARSRAHREGSPR